MPFETEFYDILEVIPTASLEDIKKSYRKNETFWNRKTIRYYFD